MPRIEILNGGDVIGAVEREDAERSFIRYYLDKPESDRPERYGTQPDFQNKYTHTIHFRYFDLVSIHGKLDPLVSIDLSPERRVKITFTYGNTSEERTVDVYRLVLQKLNLTIVSTTVSSVR